MGLCLAHGMSGVVFRRIRQRAEPSFSLRGELIPLVQALQAAVPHGHTLSMTPQTVSFSQLPKNARFTFMVTQFAYVREESFRVNVLQFLDSLPQLLGWWDGERMTKVQKLHAVPIKSTRHGWESG